MLLLLISPSLIPKLLFMTLLIILIFNQVIQSSLITEIHVTVYFSLKVCNNYTFIFLMLWRDIMLSVPSINSVSVLKMAL